MVSLSSFDTQQLSWHDQSKSKSRLGLVPIYLFCFYRLFPIWCMKPCNFEPGCKLVILKVNEAAMVIGQWPMFTWYDESTILYYTPDWNVRTPAKLNRSAPSPSSCSHWQPGLLIWPSHIMTRAIRPGAGTAGLFKQKSASCLKRKYYYIDWCERKTIKTIITPPTWCKTARLTW